MKGVLKNLFHYKIYKTLKSSVYHLYLLVIFSLIIYVHPFSSHRYTVVQQIKPILSPRISLFTHLTYLIRSHQLHSLPLQCCFFPHPLSSHRDTISQCYQPDVNLFHNNQLIIMPSTPTSPQNTLLVIPAFHMLPEQVGIRGCIIDVLFV